MAKNSNTTCIQTCGQATSSKHQPSSLANSRRHLKCCFTCPTNIQPEPVLDTTVQPNAWPKGRTMNKRGQYNTSKHMRAQAGTSEHKRGQAGTCTCERSYGVLCNQCNSSPTHGKHCNTSLGLAAPQEVRQHCCSSRLTHPARASCARRTGDGHRNPACASCYTAPP